MCVLSQRIFKQNKYHLRWDKYAVLIFFVNLNKKRYKLPLACEDISNCCYDANIIQYSCTYVRHICLDLFKYFALVTIFHFHSANLRNRRYRFNFQRILIVWWQVTIPSCQRGLILLKKRLNLLKGCVRNHKNKFVNWHTCWLQK